MLNNRVFISHSTKTPAALADVDGLRNQLIQAGFQVLLDFRCLKGGEDWNHEIDDWMRQCGAAVILLSPAALESDWVLTEARILQWRRRFDSHLTIIPVGIGGVTRAQYRKSDRHKLLRLETLQFLEAATAESSAPAVLQALGSPVPTAPSEQQQLVDTIAAPLSRMTELEFGTVFTRLDMEPPPWRAGSQNSTTMARALAWRFLTMNVYQADQIVDALGGAIDAQAKDSICRALSAFWVRAEAAKPITEASLKQPGCGGIALNGQYLLDFTADAYVRRAFWPKGQWHIIPVEGGAGTDAVRHVTDSLLQGISRLNALSRRDPEGWLRQTKNTVLVLLPDRGLVDSQGLSQLRARFPRVTFILGTGDTLLDLSSEGYTELTHLQPAVDLNEEQEAQRAFNDAIAMLRGS
ncbi:MAG TPA: toll/interleukin-1 receptor domain-containing protein [Myxococcaceae bacterium]|jgi:hypothetical protein